MLLSYMLAATVTAAAAQPTSVMILPLEAKEGVSRDAADQLSSAMAAHASTLPGLKVVTYREVESTLSQEQVRQVAGCGSVSCAAEIAGALNTNAIVMGSFGRFGADYLLTLSLVSARDAVVTGRSVRRFPGKQMEAVLDAIPQITAELFGKMLPPEAFAATQPAQTTQPPPSVAVAPATPVPPSTPADPAAEEDPDGKWAKPAAEKKRSKAAVRRGQESKATGLMLDPVMASWMYRAAAGAGSTAGLLATVGLGMCVGGCGFCIAGGYLGGEVGSGTQPSNGGNGPLFVGIGALLGVLSFFPFIGSVLVGAVAAVVWAVAQFAGRTVVTHPHADDDD